MSGMIGLCNAIIYIFAVQQYVKLKKNKVFAKVLFKHYICKRYDEKEGCYSARLTIKCY